MPQEGVVSTHQFTQYVDNVGRVEVAPKIVSSIQMGRGNPYVPDNIKEIMGRSYRTASFSWPAAAPYGTSLYSLKFPEEFKNFPFILDRLKNYRYFRCRAKVTMRMNTTKFQYGTLMVSYIPFYDPAGTFAFRHLTPAQAVQNNGMIFSANVGNTLEFELPFVSPLSWWDLQLVGQPNNIGMLASVFVHVLNPLSSVSQSPPTTAEVSVFVQMLDCEVAGLYPDYGSSVSVARGQSGDPLNALEAVTKNVKGVIAGVGSAVSTLKPVLKDVLDVGKTVGQIGALVLDKPSSVATLQSVMPDPDADFLYAKGLDYGRKLTFSPTAQAAVSEEIMAGEPNPSIKNAMMRPGYYTRFTFDSTSVTDTVVSSFIVCPGMHTIFASGANQIMNTTPIMWYSSFFNRYRGGMKVLFFFNTSSFTTARVRITHLVADTFTAAHLTDQSGDFVSRVVDIVGDTYAEVYVPFLDPKTFLKFDYVNQAQTPTDHLGVVTVSLVNPVVTPDTSAATTVFCTVFVAAAEDYEVAGFGGWRTLRAVNYGSSLPTVAPPMKLRATEVEGQTSITSLFGKPFAGLTPATMSEQRGLITQDPEMTVVELGKRYNTTTALNSYYPKAGTQDTNQEYICAPFLFFRGSTRVKWVKTTGTTTRAYYLTTAAGNVLTSVSEYCGAVHNGAPIGKYVAGAEIPFIQPYPFYEFGNTHGISPDSDIGWTGSPDNIYVALGDDFSVGYQAACPVIYYAAAVVKKFTK